ncbi:MAG: DUF7339 family protein [Sphaerochaeta sp.]
MDGKEYWERIDGKLKEKAITLTDLCEATGLNRGTLYSQRNRRAIPKTKEYQIIDDFLDSSNKTIDKSEEIIAVALYKALKAAAPSVLRGLISDYLEKKDISNLKEDITA